MPRDALALSDEFARHIHYLDLTRRKMERLYLAGSVVRRDVEQVYSGLYMDSLTSFESLIEELFVGLLSGRFSIGRGTAVPLVAFKNKQAIRPAVYGGRPYVDWLPYDRTLERAEIFFRRGVPFTNLDDDDKNFVRQCSSVRNAIAHKSAHAKRLFEQRVLANHSHLMARERTPTGYLRSVFRQNPAQTRYELLVVGLANVATKLCS